ncbi:MAG: tRNA (adenosine(37)-N6)-threonylcarbamoyltransferase complex dimerization subunit type 1 TsaB [Solirubrobacteraceae bacterium MAG38_C4-C5]|nr:tRNA (adenosine(37)-N6)-threonylcarbamoyltransferase complex dimerization subunit type 1 TsaB [Candidatus Siliceabacter maunaloa]
MTTILGFDCSTPATAVALVRDGEEPLRARHVPEPGDRPGHATQLLPLCNALLERAGLRFADLDRVAVGLGPGTFTGLRIAIATGHGLAHASGTGLVGVPTLEALAAGADGAAVLAVLDARRGEAFAAEYSDGVPTVPATALPPQALEIRARDAVTRHPSTLAVGDGAVAFRAVLERAGCTVPPDDAEIHRVDVAVLCALARDRPAGPPEAVLPFYVRAPDAQPARSSRR